MNLNDIDRVLVIKPTAEKVYNECKREGTLCPDMDYSAVDTIKGLIGEIKEIGRGMNTRSDANNDLYTIKRLFEYAETFNDEVKILKIDRDKLNQWCKYWLTSRFRDYDILNRTETLPELMVIIDPEARAARASAEARESAEARAAEARAAEERAAAARAAYNKQQKDEAEAARMFDGRPSGYGGKKTYQNRFSRKNKSHHRKNKSHHRKNKSHHRKNVNKSRK